MFYRRCGKNLFFSIFEDIDYVIREIGGQFLTQFLTKLNGQLSLCQCNLKFPNVSI